MLYSAYDYLTHIHFMPITFGFANETVYSNSSLSNQDIYLVIKLAHTIIRSLQN